MRQEEFLKSFQEALTGKVSDTIIRENVNYYRNYINQEIGSGKTEEEVLRALGDPRLLAKTIEESNKFASGEEGYAFEHSDRTFQGNRNGQNSQEQGYVKRHKTVRLPAWAMALIVIILFILIIGFVFSIISFFAPVILAAAAGILIYKLLTGGGQRKS